LKTALEEETQREPALITILISASGINFMGIGAAFWGLIAGIGASLLLNTVIPNFKKNNNFSLPFLR
jgi:benzoate membrane transport protein